MKMARMALITAMALTLSLIVTLGPALAADIGVVDIRKCLQLTDMGKEIYTEIKSEVDKIQDELTTREKELEEIRNKLEKSAGVLSDSERFRLEGELSRKSNYFKQLYGESRERIRALEQERTRPVINKLVPIIKDIAAKKGLSMVLEYGPVPLIIHYDPKIDITNDVVKAFNQKHPAGSK